MRVRIQLESQNIRKAIWPLQQQLWLDSLLLPGDAWPDKQQLQAKNTYYILLSFSHVHCSLHSSENIQRLSRCLSTNLYKCLGFHLAQKRPSIITCHRRHCHHHRRHCRHRCHRCRHCRCHRRHCCHPRRHRLNHCRRKPSNPFRTHVSDVFGTRWIIRSFRSDIPHPRSWTTPRHCRHCLSFMVPLEVYIDCSWGGVIVLAGIIFFIHLGMRYAHFQTWDNHIYTRHT